MKTTCKQYFVDPSKLVDGVAVESLEKHDEKELTVDYEELLAIDEFGAKGNKERAKKWMQAISTPNAHKTAPNQAEKL
ncbi:MAG: hypothetical protein AB1861_19515 [Cyanobacteriota bacterium]